MARARRDFLSRRPRNLEFLLRKRYAWMNAELTGAQTVIELGAGLGLSREFISHPGLVLTDVNLYPWIDKRLDALEPDLPDAAVDAVICSHAIHHLASPMRFFSQMARVIRPGGRLLIQELEASLLLRVLQRLLRNEGWSWNVDVFDPAEACLPEGAGPWTANTAIPRLLFSSSSTFERRVPVFRVVRNELSECLVFAFSGGVLTKVPSPRLGPAALEFLDKLDEILIGALPGVLALGRRVVLERRPLG